MSILKSILNGLLSTNDEKPQNTLTEDELLKAIDALPSKKPIKEEKTVPNWHVNATWVKVPKPSNWSEFKYIGKPEFKALPEVEDDGSIYFTIPCGFEWGQSVKFWFITFPLNATDDKIKGFFTVVNPVEA